MTTRRSRAAALSVLLALTPSAGLAACGSTGGSGGGGDQVVVSAASSLKQAFTTYGEQFDGGRMRASFAGSDELAAQIRQGVKPDVFAAANTKLPDELYKEGLVEKPERFATNELVLAVPSGSEAIGSLDDLAGDGVTIAIGAEGVPVGHYTRTVLGELPTDQTQAILGNVRSNEPDVAGIVGKLTQGAVDAGFVYRSDVEGADGKLKAIELPDNLEPTIEYGVAIVKDAPNPDGAQDFVDGLLDGPGAQALKDNGFGRPAGT